MPASVMTYISLLNDISVYADRDDIPFTTQLPRFVMLAENRIASEIRNLGFIKNVTDTMQVGQPVIAKPARWRQTISFNYGSGLTFNSRTTLYERSYEWCRQFCPDPTVTGAPRYYSDYDYEHFLIAATPDQPYPFEIRYHERPEPLSTANQTNWTTEYAPQLLLFGCLLEAMPFLKNPERTAEFQAAYDRAAQSITHEENQRFSDNSSKRE